MGGSPIAIVLGSGDALLVDVDASLVGMLAPIGTKSRLVAGGARRQRLARGRPLATIP